MQFPSYYSQKQVEFLTDVLNRYEAGEVLTVVDGGGSSVWDGTIYLGHLVDLKLAHRSWHHEEGASWKMLGDKPVMIDGILRYKGDWV